MKSNEKILIAILVIITICVVIFAVNRGKKNDVAGDNLGATNTVQKEEEEKFVQVTEDGTKVNTSEKLAEKKVVNNIEFTDIQLTANDGETVLIAAVKNTGDAKTEMFAVNITLLDEKGGEIKTIPGLVAPLEPGATSQFSSSTTLDYANAYDFKITAK